MKKIAVVTATRAEYGLLSPVIRELRKYENAQFKVELIVTGTHLCHEYGNTISEIKADGLRIDHRQRISIASSKESDIARNQADALVTFTELFAHEKYHAIILLGDRYEILAIAIAAGNTRTPVFHLCGGDTTEGAMDEWMRHAITKISYLHFVTNEESRKRVIQLGEHPSRVFQYGSTSMDNLANVANLTKQEVLQSVGADLCRYAVCTYHPVTMETGGVEEQMAHFVKAVERYPNIQFLVTKSNADLGGARINELLDQFEQKVSNLHVFTSLGIKRYLSLMRYAEFVLGNSSSGIIEAPAFHVPTVNIGDRQRRRLQAKSVVNCSADTESICAAIEVALSERHRKMCQSVISPYGDGHAAEKIARTVLQTLEEGIDLKKKFYDLDFVV